MDKQYFNEWSFYLDKATGYWISVSCPKKRMHIVVWEFNYGPIPEGYHVHHKDENKGNNDISNLQLMIRSEHLRVHCTEEKIEKYRKIVDQIRPLTKAWHASEEGRKWHREHGKEGWANRKPFPMICTNCGKEYFTKTFHQIFCSPNCKSSWRRKQGVDDIDAVCDYCKKIYRKNKYDKKINCSMSCAAKARRDKRNQEDRA